MNVQDLVKIYLDNLKQLGLEVQHAYIFGSFVKGKAWEGSDIDVCVISPDFKDNYQKWEEISNRIALKVDSRIEPVLFTREEFENKYDPLAAEVKQYGLEIS